MRNMLFAGVAAAALVIPAAAMAQETTSTIRGTVVSAGTPVAGATVVITDSATGQRSTVTTDAAGAFSAGGLRPGGPYTVDVSSASGNYSVTDVYTVVGQPYDVPIDLASGAAADAGTEIVVTASALAGAGSTSTGPQTLLRREDIAAVASVNRDIRDLMRRDPFARIEDTASGGRSVSFAGVNPRFNRFSIDGVIVSDNFGLNPDANPTRRGPVPIDSIAQFTVSVAPVDIRQGNFLGGAVDAVLLQGTNSFHGTGFYSQNNDSLSGKRIGSTTIPLDYKSETYGATLSGPIIKDKLFFMISAERNKQGNPLQPFSTIPGANEAAANQVASIADSVYGYDAGGILAISQDKDEKIVGKLTWNITDGQRLSLSYINAYDSIDILGNVSTNASTPGFGLQSNSYTNTELLRAGILQLNSDWSDNFSTEARFLYKYYERGRFPGGESLAQFRVCSDATNDSAVGSPAGTTNDQPTTCGTNNPIYALGVENSTQANVFFTDTYGGSIQARWSQGAHDLRLLAEMNEARIFNLFLQNTQGNYYFDSLADFQNRLASSVTYQNTATGDQNQAAADFKYRQYTFGIQDDITVTDRLNFTLGLRYDLFDADTPVPLNPGFTARYGFPNTRTIGGKGLFQPRIGANWKPVDDVKIRAGAGIFGGGTPDVYLSNSYSNAGAGVGGVAINSVTVQRCVISSSCTTGYQINGANVAAATALPLLSGVTGTSIPAGLQAQIPNTGANSLANINALDPDFEIPNVWKATLSFDWTPHNFLGGGWRFGADYYFSRTNASVFFTDIRSIPIGTLPDGRTRFGPLVGTNTNTDILLTNSSKGRSHIGVVRVEKHFDFGLDLNFAYSQQDVKDQAPATSSTAGSNYGNGAFLDGRGAAYGTSNDQVAWSFKYGVGFNHAFFDDYKTRIQLFGETQAGRPFSYTMEDAGSATRSAVFGVTGRDDRFLLYVPTGPNDPIVSYDSAATQAALENLVANSNLKDYRGKIAPRNLGRSRAYTRMDVHLEQEIPTFVGKSRISLFADIENLPNLLNKNWGGFRQAIFPYVEDAVRVQCLSTATPTGTAPGAGVVNSSPGQPCAQYRYSSFIEPNASTLEVRRSLYLIRVGARFSF
ncbi:MAG: TonB-dependent receptor [Sphingomonas sp.]|uniref:TonB-dependent receptor n=1 Tax=Sphingomonas sp. TaxID=28214 RepID=UPI001B05A5D8|nr:TonB-dependent receptor [Sphingomonas sp.]MBO9624251.1 TonB-dependent receptor [Sphingomonas sp.]